MGRQSTKAASGGGNQELRKYYREVMKALGSDKKLKRGDFTCDEAWGWYKGALKSEAIYAKVYEHASRGADLVNDVADETANRRDMALLSKLEGALVEVQQRIAAGYVHRNAGPGVPSGFDTQNTPVKVDEFGVAVK